MDVILTSQEGDAYGLANRLERLVCPRHGNPRSPAPTTRSPSSPPACGSWPGSARRLRRHPHRTFCGGSGTNGTSQSSPWLTTPQVASGISTQAPGRLPIGSDTTIRASSDTSCKMSWSGYCSRSLRTWRFQYHDRLVASPEEPDGRTAPPSELAPVALG